MKLVECVPNFSEGRDKRLLEAIANAVRSVDGVDLLDMDPGEATNRTVFTFVGTIDAIEEAAVRAIEKASSLIDMRNHKGAHPRMGATDVCPFVPLGDTTMAECVELARRVGGRVAESLDLPVFLYEEAATRPDRRSLASIRRGEYEGMATKLADPEWAPDFGPASHNPKLGATAVGAREFLIAYNVNLNTRDRRLANRIAQNIRETGRPKRGADGKIMQDANGKIITEPGASMLPAVRATGWYIEEYGLAQVSINLTNFKTTPAHTAFDAVCEEAAKLGLRVTGSEVVGLIPREAVLAAGRHYLTRQGKTPAVPEPELVRTAAVSLGLADLSEFDPARKIIEYRVSAAHRLPAMTVEGFCDEVSSGSPVPGGGSVSALLGALSGALTAMVAAVSYGRKGFESRRDDLERLGLEAQAIKARLVQAVEEDARSFDRVLEANRMPRKTEADRKARDKATQEATREAIAVPLAVMRHSVRAMELAAEIAQKGVETAVSDAGVAVLAAGAAVDGAGYNVAINLPGLADVTEAEAFSAEAAGLREKASRLRDKATDEVGRSLVAQSSPAK